MCPWRERFCAALASAAACITTASNILPLTGASTTEIRGVHPPFATNVFFPVQPWSVNYFSQLTNAASGFTQLQAIPAQFLSDAASLTNGTLRQYDRMDFRLFYNNNIQTYAGNSVPALAAAPTILNVSAVGTPSQVNFTATVLANPSVGVQSVWVTYTALNGPFYGQWQSLDLVQDAADSTRWSATLPLSATAPTDVRYIVQAVNGVGLVSLSTNIGRYFTPNLVGGPTQTTQLTMSAPASGVYGSPVNLSATLTSAGATDRRAAGFAASWQSNSGWTHRRERQRDPDDRIARFAWPKPGYRLFCWLIRLLKLQRLCAGGHIQSQHPGDSHADIGRSPAR